MTLPWTRHAIAALALALCSSAMGQVSTIDLYDRCLSDSSTFAANEKLNEVVTEYLAGIQREIDSSLDISRVAGMAGLKDRSTQARLRADKYMQELQQACAHISQSMKEPDRHLKADQFAPAQDTQTAERQRQSVIEHELNRRVSGATFLMNEIEFSQWLDGKQGKVLRRDLWDQAIMAESFERAAQMLRDYERSLRSK
jgi:hypothetical protein